MCLRERRGRCQLFVVSLFTCQSIDLLDLNQVALEHAKKK